MIPLLSKNDLAYIQKAIDRQMPITTERTYSGIYLRVDVQTAPEVHHCPMLASCYCEKGSIVSRKHCHSAEEVDEWQRGL